MRFIFLAIFALFLTAGYSQSDCLIVIPTRGTDSVVLNTNQILYAVQAPSSSTANIVITDFSNVQTRISLDSLIALLPDLIKFTDSQNNYPTGINKQQIRQILKSATNKAVLLVNWNKQLRYTSTQSYASIRSLADACSSSSDGSGVTDGDKGDITVNGDNWVIDNGTITWPKLSQAVKDSIQANGGTINDIDTSLTLSPTILAKAASVYGTTRLVDGAEKAFRVQRADGYTIDFTFLPSGYLDATQIEGFLNGQIGYVTVLYDQKGTNHATQSNILFAPTIMAYEGKIKVDFSGNGLKNLRYTVSSSISNANNAIYTVISSRTASQTSNISTSTSYLSMGTSWGVKFNNSSSPLYCWQVENGATRSSVNVFPVNHDHVLYVNSSNVGTTVYGNEKTRSLAAGNGTTSSVFNIGDSLNTFQGNVLMFAHFSQSLSSAELDTLNTIASNNYNLVSKSDAVANLVFEGNSITHGSADPEWRGWAERIGGQKNIHRASFAVSGSVVSDVVARAAVVDSVYIPGKNNVLAVWIGTNDIFNLSASSTTTWNALSAYITARKAKGWKVVALTCLPRSIPNGSRDTARVAYNTLMKASLVPDYVVDIAADTAFLWYTDVYGVGAYYRHYLADGIHPTREGHKRIAANVAPVLSQALGLSVVPVEKPNISEDLIGARKIYTQAVYGKNPKNGRATLVLAPDESGNTTTEAGTLILNPGPYNWMSIGYPSRGVAQFAYRHNSNISPSTLSFVGGATGKDVLFVFGADTRNIYAAPAAFRLTTSDEFEFNTNGTGTLRRNSATRLFWNSQGVGINTTTLSIGTELEVNGDINATTYRLGDPWRAINYGSTSPEGVVLSLAGSLYIRATVGDDVLYVKTTGSSGSPVNTGWKAALLAGTPITLPAGTATAGTSPLKLTAGTNTSTPEAGAFGEYDGTEFYATNSTTTRTILARVLKGSATLDFGSTAAGAVTDLTITVTGAVDGDVVSLSVPNASQTTTGSFSAWVSATNTVTVRYRIAALVGSEDPASGVFKVTVTK